MVIVRGDGTLILDGGDPAFESVQDLGADSATNYILDPDPNKPLSQFILESYGIPFQLHDSTGRVLGGTLPGYDVRNQDATTMMKLSLAVEIRSTGDGNDPSGVGEFAEVEIDEFGIARFYIVGEELATDLEIRQCVPTVQIQNPADLVIVRGYDPPPRRELRNSFDGLKNALVYEYEECARESCDERAVGKYAAVSFDDPLLDQVYLDDVVNSYELQAFENLVGYIVDLDLPSGADPDAPNYRPGLKITFGDTTTEYVKIPSGVLNAFIQDLGQTGNGVFDAVTGLLSGNTGLTSANLIFGANSNSGNSTTVVVNTVDPKTGECQTVATSIAGSKIVIPASRFIRENKFGNLESDFVGVQEVVFTGRKVTQINFQGGFAILIFVKPNKQLVRLEQGKNWTWTVNGDGDIELEFFSLIEDEFTASVCSIYQGNTGEATPSRYSTALPNIPEEVGALALEGLICNVGDRLGYLAPEGELCVVVDRKRPSIDVFDPNGDASLIAREFLTLVSDSNSPGVYQNGSFIPNVRRSAGVRYTPIVIVDEPSPIAYAATGPLQSIDAQTGSLSSKTLNATGIIDQTDGIRDSDPTTVQDFDESEVQILQDNTNGSTIDITLPFLDGDGCLDVAQNLLALQQSTVTTQSIVLGPDSNPKLGQQLPDGSIINEINYSYSDGSQYLISITAGPKYLTAGSFQNSTYQLQTEDVTREGIVAQDKGNGAEYVVRVDGFGETTALSMILEEISVGDRVNVRLYNSPVEKR